MKTNMIWGAICGAAGAAGSGIASLLGGWTSDMAALLIFMGIDFVLGLIAAAIFHASNKSGTGALESRACFKGLCRKFVMLLFVMIAYRLDLLLGLSYIRTAVVLAFLVNELLSIIENAGLCGVPVPAVIRRAIEVLRDKSED